MGYIADKTGGGGRLRRVGFGAKNGDYSARAAVTYAKYAPLHALAKPHFYHPNPTASNSTSKSPDSSSTILESFGYLLTFLAFSKVDSSPKILESIALESKKLSLRALAQDKAWQSIHSTHSKPAESKRHKLHTSTYSLHTILESQAHLKSPTNLESIFEKTQMDCHADFQSARNDDENAQSLSASQAAVKSSKT